MRYGIPNNGFERLKAALKEAAEYTEDWSDNWEEEYGEDWSEPSYDEPEPLMPAFETSELDISSEDFIKGEVILAAMGYDVENMGEEEITQLLQSNPQYFELTPQFNVQGQWVHTLRQTDLMKIEEAVKNVAASSKEMCVTSGDAAEFWNFSEYRIIAIVLEGVCKVFWNADMYSFRSVNTGQLTTTVDTLEHVNKMTEGWLVPAECNFVGLKVNWDALIKGKDFKHQKAVLEQIAENLGVPIVNQESFEKQLVGLDILSIEDAAKYDTCDLEEDAESPEHLYEPYEHEAPYEYSTEYKTHMEYYQEQLREEVKKGNIAEIQNLLSMGVTLQPVEFQDGGILVSNLAQNKFPNEILYALVKPLENSPDDLSLILQDAATLQYLDLVELLIDMGGTLNEGIGGVFAVVALIQNKKVPEELLEKILPSYFQAEFNDADTLFWYVKSDISDEAANLIFNELDQKLSYHVLEKVVNKNKELLETLREICPQVLEPKPV